MLVKSADDRSSDIDALNALLQHPTADEDTKKKIDLEIRKMMSGLKGEREAVYEIDFYFKSSSNWAVIHDLRLEHKGRIAQIDHLLINRLFEIWVCEGKRFMEGINVNAQGECTSFYNGKPQGIGSPFEQNKKHIAVLQALCDTGAVKLPRRLGITIKPSYHNLVVVSKNARITKPYEDGWWSDGLIKVDQVKGRIERVPEGGISTLTNLAKVVSVETLENFAHELASMHQPLKPDWAARFGLLNEKLPIVPAPELDTAPPLEKDRPKSKLVCLSCDAAVTYNVAKFCWTNKTRFKGDIFCMDCQKNVA